MENQIKITVCCGTTCHLMGSSELLVYKDEIEKMFNFQVVIYGSPCLGYCQNATVTQAPFVLVGDHVIKQANKEKVIEYLSILFGEKGVDYVSNQ